MVTLGVNVQVFKRKYAKLRLYELRLGKLYLKSLSP